MPKLTLIDSGEEVWVSQDSLQGALASGAYVKDPNLVVHTKDNRGNRGTVKLRDLDKAQTNFATGAESQESLDAASLEAYREDEFGGTLDTASTFGRNLLSGATFGLSDLAIKGDAVEQEIRRIEDDVNPYAAVSGQVVGAIAPGLLSGGSGAAGSIARLLPSGQLALRTGKVAKALGGLKGAVVAGALEGSVFGAGQGVSNIALSDEPLTAEAAFHEIGMNALYGGAFGAAGGALGTGMVKLGNKVKQNLVKRTTPVFDLASTEGKALQSTLKLHADDIDDVAERILAKADDRASTGFKHVFDEDLAEFNFKALQQQKSDALEYVSTLSSGSRVPSKVAKAASKVEEVETKIASLLKDKRGVLDFSRGASLPQAQLKKLGGLYDNYTASVATLAKETGAPIQAVVSRPVSNQIVQSIDGVGDLAASARVAHADYLKKLGGVDGKTSMAALFKQAPEEAIETLAALDASNKKMLELAELVGGKEGAKLKAATDGLSEAVTTATGKTGSSLPPAAELALIFGVEETLLPDFDGPLDDILKFYLATKAIGKFSKSGGLASKAMAAVSGKLPGGKALNIASGFVNDSVARLATATGSSLNRLQAGLSKSLEVGGKAAKRSSPLTSQLLSDVSFGGDKPEKGQTAHAAFKARSEELSAAVANMPATEQRLHDRLAAVRQTNEGVGDKLAGHAKATLEFLHTKMPKDPGVLQYFGASRWRPTDPEMDKWARYIRAAQDPAGVVERFGAGHMSREDAETLRTLYPAHFSKVQGWIMEHLPEMQQKLSYERRIQASSLMGVAADPIMAKVDVWQSSFEQPDPEERPSMDIKNSQRPTTAQQLVGGEEL